MKRILIYTVCFLGVFSSSCTLEEVEVPSGDMVSVNLSTRSLDPSIPVRILVVNSADGSVALNRYPATADSDSKEYKIKLPAGKYHFYLMGNEPARLTNTLNNITRQSQLSELNIQAEELPPAESPANPSTTLSNIPILGMATGTVRLAAGKPGKGEVSTDNGSTWSATLNLSMKRLAVKVLFGIRKNTSNPNDKVTIRKIEIINTPAYSSVLERAYSGADYHTLCPWDNPSGYEFSQNSDSAIPFISDQILPEYVMANPDHMEEAAAIKVYAQYNQTDVVYHIPVRGLERADYSLSRNNYYIIIATISKTPYFPEIRYQVAEWTEATDNPGFIDETAIQFESHWAAGTSVDPAERKVYVRENEYVEYYFTLNYPLAATWAATITNPIDFMFDYSAGAVSSGKAMQGVEYKIRIKPRKGTSQNDVKTEFFITVNNGLGNVELNLPATGVGTGNRYTIIQIPN